MKTYRFETSLTKTEIFERLAYSARKNDRTVTDTIVYYPHEPDSFRLVKRRFAGQKQFYAALHEKDGKTVITGCFLFPKLPVYATAIIAVLQFLLNMPFPACLLFAVCGAAAWLLAVWLFGLFADFLEKQLQADVLNFIEQNLCREKQ